MVNDKIDRQTFRRIPHSAAGVAQANLEQAQGAKRRSQGRFMVCPEGRKPTKSAYWSRNRTGDSSVSSGVLYLLSYQYDLVSSQMAIRRTSQGHPLKLLPLESKNWRPDRDLHPDPRIQSPLHCTTYAIRELAGMKKERSRIKNCDLIFLPSSLKSGPPGFAPGSPA